MRHRAGLGMALGLMLAGTAVYAEKESGPLFRVVEAQRGAVVFEKAVGRAGPWRITVELAPEADPDTLVVYLDEREVPLARHTSLRYAYDLPFEAGPRELLVSVCPVGGQERTCEAHTTRIVFREIPPPQFFVVPARPQQRG